MIRHILKIIWNERRTNAWLMLEYILVFCILWFCCDFLYTTARSYLEPTGFDIEHTYRITMGRKTGDAAVELPQELDELTMAHTLRERLEHYPGIEAVGFSRQAVPHVLGWNQSGYRVNADSINTQVRVRTINPGFLDVFRIPVLRGQVADWPDDSKKDDWLIYPDRAGMLGDHPVGEVRTFRLGTNDGVPFYATAVGYTPPLKANYFAPYDAGIFTPLQTKDFKATNEISIRVRPEADHDFPEKFRKDMTEQLQIGNYYVASITPLTQMAKDAAYNDGQSGKVNSVFAITAFLIINIFLGILGSFWFRTQSRRSEIGLRLALGASKKKVKALLLGETLLLLSVASIIGTLISLHISTTDLISDLGIPYTDREAMGIGMEQNGINFGLTFAFLALVSLIAVWYPARQASKTQPAEALHEE